MTAATSWGMVGNVAGEIDTDEKSTKVNVEHIGHVVKMSVSGCRYRRFEPRLHQNVVSLSRKHNPHCFSRLSCEMSSRREHPREGSLFRAVSSPEEIAMKHQHNGAVRRCTLLRIKC